MAIKCDLMGHKFHLQSDGRYAECTCGETFRFYPDEEWEQECENHRWDSTFWNSDTFDTIKGILGIILVLCILLAIITLPVMYADKATCMSYKDLGIPVHWGWWTSCMANHPQYGWIPVEKYFEVLNLFVNP